MSINLKRQYDQVQRGKTNLLRTLGNNGVTMFKVKNFESQGFIDSGVSRWKPKKKPDGRKTLVGETSILRNTIYYKVVRGIIEFGTLAKYGKVHNEGLRSGRGKGFKMPQRQFMGESAALNKINGRSIGKFLKNIMK